MVIGTPASWTAVVGIPLDARPGALLPLAIERPQGAGEFLQVAVGTANYTVQYLTVKQEQVDLSSQDLQRYERERIYLENVRRVYSDRSPASLRLIQP